jgi:hypothetical protein
MKLLSDSVNPWHHYAVIIHNIKYLLANDWSVKVVHTLREGNTCADYLAKLGAHNPEVYSPIAIPPSEMSLLLLADASGTLFSRQFFLVYFSFPFPPCTKKKKRNNGQSQIDNLF